MPSGSPFLRPFLLPSGSAASGKEIYRNRYGRAPRCFAPFLRSGRGIPCVEACGVVANFAAQDRLPEKQGGGIVAVWPGKLTVCVWSPGLDPSGNSMAGTRALELFARRTGASVFQRPPVSVPP
ncbi:MAG: glutaminase [Alphaproteobacteria bacterium]